MKFGIHVRAEHPGQGRKVERTVATCPVLIGREAASSGRDVTAAAVDLVGDSSVSKAHASVDVRDGRIWVYDVGSTNGVVGLDGRLSRDRWNDLGPDTDEHTIRIGGWHVHVRSCVVDAPPAETTIVDALPFDSPPQQSAGDSGFSAPAERLRQAVEGVREARRVLDRALAREIRSAPENERAKLAAFLREKYPELVASDEIQALAEPVPPTPPAATPEKAALAALQDIACFYVGSDRVLGDAHAVWSFARRLREGLDAFGLGTADATALIDSYVHELRIAAPPDEGFPRDAVTLGRVVFDWQRSPTDGAAIVRRAFHGLYVHHTAFLSAVCAGVNALLRELAPEMIEAQRDQALAGVGFWRRLLARWTEPGDFVKEYRRRHDDLAGEESAQFSLFFGPAFTDRYRTFASELREQTQAADLVAASARGRGNQVMSLPPRGT